MNRQVILDKTKKYIDAENKPKFIPGETFIPVSAKSIDGDDISNLVDASLDERFTEGRFVELFKKDLRDYYKGEIRDIALCNSGSSANLLAVSAITAHEFGSRRAMPGDEIITVAIGSPTTINPIIQNKLVPVFMDVQLGTFTPNPIEIEQVITPRTKAIMLAHPFGNLFDIPKIRDIADEYDLYLIEDSTQSLGGSFGEYKAGSVGDISTLSFNSSKQITSGDGGAIISKSYVLNNVIESFRSWDGDVYNHVGYNLKFSDLQASLLVSQLKKLNKFVAQRLHNWKYLHKRLQKYHKYFILPEATEGCNPSWLGFCLTIKEGTSFTREEIMQFLGDNKIGVRPLFGGNLLKQPMYKGVHHKVVTNLFNTDICHHSSFYLGVHPGIDGMMLEYIADKMDEFMKGKLL